MLKPKCEKCSSPNQAIGSDAIASLRNVPSGSFDKPCSASPNRVVTEPIHSSGRIGPPGP